jgi:hypothetical protein
MQLKICARKRRGSATVYKEARNKPCPKHAQVAAPNAYLGFLAMHIGVERQGRHGLPKSI